MIKIILATAYLTYFSLITLHPSMEGQFALHLGLLCCIVVVHLTARYYWAMLGARVGADMGLKKGMEIKEKIIMDWMRTHLDQQTLQKIGKTAQEDLDKAK